MQYRQIELLNLMTLRLLLLRNHQLHLGDLLILLHLHLFLLIEFQMMKYSHLFHL
jgi:hypothetical protein